MNQNVKYVYRRLETCDEFRTRCLTLVKDASKRSRFSVNGDELDQVAWVELQIQCKIIEVL